MPAWTQGQEHGCNSPAICFGVSAMAPKRERDDGEFERHEETVEDEEGK